MVPRSTKKLDSVYNVGKELGKGSFAVVKLVQHKENNQKFAAKIIDTSELEETGKEMIEIEAEPFPTNFPTAQPTNEPSPMPTPDPIDPRCTPAWLVICQQSCGRADLLSCVCPPGADGPSFSCGLEPPSPAPTTPSPTSQPTAPVTATPTAVQTLTPTPAPVRVFAPPIPVPPPPQTSPPTDAPTAEPMQTTPAPPQPTPTEWQVQQPTPTPAPAAGSTLSPALWAVVITLAVVALCGAALFFAFYWRRREQKEMEQARRSSMRALQNVNRILDLSQEAPSQQQRRSSRRSASLAGSQRGSQRNSQRRGSEAADVFSELGLSVHAMNMGVVTAAAQAKKAREAARDAARRAESEAAAASPISATNSPYQTPPQRRARVRPSPLTRDRTDYGDHIPLTDVQTSAGGAVAPSLPASLDGERAEHSETQSGRGGGRHHRHGGGGGGGGKKDRHSEKERRRAKRAEKKQPAKQAAAAVDAKKDRKLSECCKCRARCGPSCPCVQAGRTCGGQYPACACDEDLCGNRVDASHVDDLMTKGSQRRAKFAKARETNESERDGGLATTANNSMPKLSTGKLETLKETREVFSPRTAASRPAVKEIHEGPDSDSSEYSEDESLESQARKDGNHHHHHHHHHHKSKKGGRDADKNSLTPQSLKHEHSGRSKKGGGGLAAGAGAGLSRLPPARCKCTGACGRTCACRKAGLTCSLDRRCACKSGVCQNRLFPVLFKRFTTTASLAHIIEVEQIDYPRDFDLTDQLAMLELIKANKRLLTDLEFFLYARSVPELGREYKDLLHLKV